MLEPFENDTIDAQVMPIGAGRGKECKLKKFFLV
jgi:hypothetical protein